MLVSIVDYGMGNILSITNALEYLGVDVILTYKETELRNSDKIILPGVGSFRVAMQNLKERKLDVILNELVMKEHKDILGICLGMQLFASGSDEDGFSEGLGWFSSVVKNMSDKLDDNVKVPHIGFESIETTKKSILYKDIRNHSDFYFVHSFSMENIYDEITSTYNIGNTSIVASIEKDNIFGVQFHPEKSQDNGLRLLKNFLQK